MQNKVFMVSSGGPKEGPYGLQPFWTFKLLKFGPFLKFNCFKILSPLKIYFMYYAGKRLVLITHISFKKMV